MGKIDLVRVTSWHRPRRVRTMSIIVIIVTITGPAVGRGGLLNKIITFRRRTTVCLGQSPRRCSRGTQTAAGRATAATRVFSGAPLEIPWRPRSDRREKLHDSFLKSFTRTPHAPFRGGPINTKRAPKKAFERLRIGSTCRRGCGGGNVRIWKTRNDSGPDEQISVWSCKRSWKRQNCICMKTQNPYEV